MQAKQTVKIFLAEGNPTGLRSLELFNWNGKGYVIPRDRADEALKRDELNTQGVYILIGENKDGKQQIYIGESESINNRLRSHHKAKDFWEVAVCFFSKDKNLNKAHVKFLEELLIKEALEAGRVVLENGNQPQQTRLSESDESEVLIFAENIKLILSTIGYTFLKKPTEYEFRPTEFYICKGPAAIAKAIYTSEGIIVKKGSLTRIKLANSVPSDDSMRRKQYQLITDGVLVAKNDESFEFSQDYVFSSPSMAAALVLARGANGWTEWKRESDGKTLDDVYRKGE